MKLTTGRPALSIVMKVSILAGSIAALASLVVGSLIISGTTDIVYQDALNRLKYETNIKSLRLVSDIKNLSGDSQYVAGTPPVLGIPRATNNAGIDPLDQSSLQIWRSRLETIFTELIRAKPNYLQIRYIGIANNGKELVRVERSGNLIRALPDNELQEKGNTNYFKTAKTKKTGEVYLSDVSLNREFGKVSIPHTPVIRAASPVYFNNTLFGIIVINMTFAEIFNELIKNTPRELTPYVTNEDGFFLAHPDRTMTYGFDLGNENRLQNTYKNFDLRKNTDIRDNEFTIETPGDVIHIVKAHYDPAREDRFFSVMLATSHENLQSGSRQLRFQNFLIMGLLVFISLIVARLLASQLMRPLQTISKASEDLAKGREVLNLPVESRDEIGELARAFDHMRQQLEEKERELIVSQGQVHHANKLASLGEMASGMAHEINSPIQTINLIAQRVQRQLKKNMSVDEIDASMQKITASVSKISEIINSLRMVSRDSTGDNFTDTTLRDLVKDVIHMTEERFKVKNIHFEVSYKDVSESSQLQCQRLQISQVLINLVNNAYDAIQTMENKWIRIDISKISDKIQFSVTDSGLGISNEIADRIFEPMFTTKEIGKGTGLGLSISHDIVSKHNGKLYIDLDSDHTHFVMQLPVKHL